MALEKINSIVGQQAYDEIAKLKSDVKSAGDTLAELASKAATIELKLGDVQTVAELNAALKELRTTTEAVQKVALEQAKATNELAKAELSRQKTATESVKTQREEQKLKEEILKSQDKLNAARVSEQKQLDQLSSDYTQLSKAYNDATLRAKNYALVLGETHPLTIQAVNDAKAMGDTLKRLDATVGQYQRNVGNYNMVGMQFNQLLRELPNLAQSPQTFIQSLSNNISYFGESIKAARAEGQSWGQIFGTLTGSLTGMVGILNIGVLALTYFGNEMANSKKQTDEATVSIKQYEDSIVSLIQQENKMRAMRSNAYGEGVRQAERELELRRAQGATDKEILDLENRVSSLKIRDLQHEKDAYSVLTEEIRRSFEYYTKQKGYKDDVVRNEMAKDKDIINSLMSVTGSTREEAEKQAKAIADSYNTRETIIKTFSKRITEIDQDIADEQNQINVNTANYLRTHITLLKQQIDSLPVIHRGDAFVDTQPIDDYTASVKDLSTELEGVSKLLDEIQKKIKSEFAAENRKQILDTLNTIQSFVNTFSSIVEITKNNSNARISALEKERDTVDTNYKFEIDRINASMQAGVDRENAVKDAQAKAAAQRAQIAAQERQEKIRQAKLDKALAIANAVINTARAVVEALPNYVKAIAVGVAGAVQVAAISSTPIPEYEEGTLSHKGGKFIAGDGGESELVITPSGKAYMTKATPTLYNEPKGTMVLNQDMIHNIMYGAMTAQALRGIEQKSGYSGDEIKQLIETTQTGNRNIVRAIRSIKTTANVSINGNDPYLSRLKYRTK